MSLDKYICTFPIRALWSTVISVVSFVALAMVVDNATGNNYKHLKKDEKTFEVIFFAATGSYESLTALMYTFFFIRYRKQEDITGLNSVDCKCTCLLFFLRVAFTVTLSLIMIIAQSKYTIKDVSSTDDVNGAREREY